ncbi:MAG TPA: response regulator [Dissulfurispiraceae bacterium]|nr:response regulator [Dissulfurispiraceae bacterium]
MELVPGTGTILLVDDQELVLDVCKDMLSMLGYTVLTANNGLEAVAVFERNSVDLVVLDYILPGMTGSEIFDRIRAIRADACILVASGYSRDGLAGELLNRGCCGYLQKPYNILELSRKIRDVLEPPGERSLRACNVSSLPPAYP